MPLQPEHPVEQKEVEALYFLRQYPPSKTVVSFSGGKDSLVALHLAYRAGIRRAVFSDTTVEPKETIKFVKEVATILGIELEILKPRKSFWELAEYFGPPSINNRWCCPTIKFQQLNEYARKNDVQYYVTGLRRDESLIRREYEKVSKNPMMPNVIQLNPIINWTKKDVWRYIEKHNLPRPPIYQHLGRNGCLICPYKSPKELEKVREVEPELWNKFKEFLEFYAQKVGILDVEKFLNYGWRVFRQPIRRKPVKIDDLDIKKFRLLKILDSNNSEERKRVLIEKEINCVGCGACLAVCPNNALKINDKGVIDVEIEKCVHCYLCITSNQLRKSCIARNYKLEIFVLEEF